MKEKKMKRMTFTAITFAIMVMVIALLMAVGGPQISVSGQSNEGHEPSLVGVWVTQVTRTNCETGATIGVGQIQLTFAEGGTLLETIGPSTIRSPGTEFGNASTAGTSIPMPYGSCDTMRRARLSEARLSGWPSHSTRRVIITRQRQQMTS